MSQLRSIIWNCDVPMIETGVEELKLNGSIMSLQDSVSKRMCASDVFNVKTVNVREVNLEKFLLSTFKDW